jgi:adenylate cyclase
LWHLSKATSEDNALAEKFFQQAIDHDPGFAGAYRGLSISHANATDFLRHCRYEMPSSVEKLAPEAVALDPSNAEARSSPASALNRRGDYEAALTEVECALAMSPNLANAHGILGAILVFSRRPREGVSALERNLRLDPRDPQRIFRLNQIVSGLYFA